MNVEDYKIHFRDKGYKKRIPLYSSKDGEPFYRSRSFNFKGSEMELFL
ncbi:hypothetical protein SFC65_13170 [Priestia filamentosa]|nr:hypothetical protein [Priestia filamentosa]